jgi:hypothetical protein
MSGEFHELNGKLSQFRVEWVADNRVSEVVDCARAAARKPAAMRSHETQFPPEVLEGEPAGPPIKEDPPCP